MSTTTLTPEQRKLRAQIAALTRWAHEDPQANAQRGQAGLLDKFRREIAAAHPDLPPAELERRAECARRAHMKRLAYAAVRARRAARAEVSSG